VYVLAAEHGLIEVINAVTETIRLKQADKNVMDLRVICSALDDAMEAIHG
jgi:hypothetical protein